MTTHHQTNVPLRIALQFTAVAQNFPNMPAVVSDVAEISYLQLLGSAISFAKRLRALGVDRTSTIALNTGDMPSSLSVMLASSFLGCQLITASELLSRQQTVTPTHFVKTPEAKGKSTVDFIEIDETWFDGVIEISREDIDAFEGHDSLDDPWLLLHTSGTTGKPKFMALTNRIVSDRTKAIAADFPTAQITCALLFNCTSRPFYARAIGALLNACTIIDSRSLPFWQKMGVNAFFCSPSQYDEFFEGASFEGKFAKIEVSGAKLTDEVARRLADNFETIVDIYGASETNKSYANFIKVKPDGTVMRMGRKLDSEIQIIDEDGNLCAPGTSGVVRVRNSYLIDGYISAPKATDVNFKDGWFFPGDIATWGPANELNIIGRTDEVISFGGVKLDADLIDRIFKATIGVKDGACIKNPRADRREVTGFIVYEPGVDKQTVDAAIRENYQMCTGLPCFLGRLHTVNKIPRTAEGRPLRNVLESLVPTGANENSAKADI